MVVHQASAVSPLWVLDTDVALLGRRLRALGLSATREVSRAVLMAPFPGVGAKAQQGAPSVLGLFHVPIRKMGLRTPTVWASYADASGSFVQNGCWCASVPHRRTC